MNYSSSRIPNDQHRSSPTPSLQVWIPKISSSHSYILKLAFLVNKTWSIGVVGYHVSLTRIRSTVQSCDRSIFFNINFNLNINMHSHFSCFYGVMGANSVLYFSIVKLFSGSAIWFGYTSCFLILGWNFAGFELGLWLSQRSIFVWWGTRRSEAKLHPQVNESLTTWVVSIFFFSSTASWTILPRCLPLLIRGFPNLCNWCLPFNWECCFPRSSESTCINSVSNFHIAEWCCNRLNISSSHTGAYLEDGALHYWIQLV